VVRDLHAIRSGEEVAGGIEDAAHRIPGGVAIDEPAWGSSGVGVDAGIPKGVAVDHVAVTTRVHDRDVAVVGDTVEIGRSGVTIFGHTVLVIAEAAHSCLRAETSTMFPKHLDDLVDAVGR